MKHRTLLVPFIALVALLLFNALFTPGFFAVSIRDGHLFGSLIDILNRSVPVLILSMGMALVIATAGVDLSVGAVMAVAGATAACLIARPEGSPIAGLPVPNSLFVWVGVGLIAALACGLFNGLLVAYLELQPIVATLLLMVAGRGVAQLLTNGQIVTFTDASFAAIGSGHTVGLPNPIWIGAGVAALTTLFTRRTAFGLFLEASGGNPIAARYSGIDAKKVKLIAYAISGLCAGLAGLIATADIKGADANNVGLYLELDAILAVALGGASLAGGKFSLSGTVLGAILMQTLTTTVFARGVPPPITMVLKALIVVAVCLLQSPQFTAMTRRRPA